MEPMKTRAELSVHIEYGRYYSGVWLDLGGARVSPYYIGNISVGFSDDHPRFMIRQELKERLLASTNEIELVITLR